MKSFAQSLLNSRSHMGIQSLVWGAKLWLPTTVNTVFLFFPRHVFQRVGHEQSNSRSIVDYMTLHISVSEELEN